MKLNGWNALPMQPLVTNYRTVEYQSEIYELGDNVKILSSEEGIIYRGVIMAIFRNHDEGNVYVTVRWYLRWKDLPVLPPRTIKPFRNELLYSCYVDNVSVTTLYEKFDVCHISTNIPSSFPSHLPFVRFLYDHTEKQKIIPWKSNAFTNVVCLQKEESIPIPYPRSLPSDASPPLYSPSCSYSPDSPPSSPVYFSTSSDFHFSPASPSSPPSHPPFPSPFLSSNCTSPCFSPITPSSPDCSLFH